MAGDTSPADGRAERPDKVPDLIACPKPFIS